jgi:hypothetical protein
MIIKLTLVGLIIALIAIIATSYYVNKEGFNDITAQTLNTCTGDCNNTLTAANKVCRAVAQTDGNYVIYDSTNKPMWASNTYGKGAAPYRTVMQSDGNLVLYDKNNQPIWASNTSGKGVGPFRLVMQDDCNLVVYDKNNQATWASKSNPVTPGLSYNPAPAPAGETPANISLARLQELFNNAGCTTILSEGDQVKWWRSRPNVSDIIADMKAYGDLTRTCTGNDRQHNFCNPDKCKKPGMAPTVAPPVAPPMAPPVASPMAPPVASPMAPSVSPMSGPAPSTTTISISKSLPESTAAPVTMGGMASSQMGGMASSQMGGMASSQMGASLLNSVIPERHDVIPQVALSDSGYKAMELQQRADLLKDIQKVVRNEILANRSTDPVASAGSIDKVTDSMLQGKEYEGACYKGTENRCPRNPDGTCPPVPDMSKYIKKDEIPCYGCTLDY